MTRRIVDLTMTIEEGMQTFAAPWHPFVEITQLGRHGIENRETRKLTLGTHTGTHVDAPRHFLADGQTLDNIPLDRFVGPATVVDFSQVPPRSEIGVAALEEAVGARPTDRLILRFDGDRTLGTASYYSDHAYLSNDACRWLVKSGCRLLAMDTPQPDNPLHGGQSDYDSPNHKILLGNDCLLVEYLVNLSALRRNLVEFIVAPLLIRNADGAPARCFAIEKSP